MRYFAQFILLFLLSASIAFASIGHISALNGDVSIVRDTKTIKAKAGSELEKSDVVKSSVGSVAQLVFNDKTIITVGSNTVFSIKEYIYDDKTPNAKFGVEKGYFKTVTGQIGKVAPDKFKLETKTATLGIRGTEFKGFVDESGNLFTVTTKGKTVVTSNIPNVPTSSTEVPAGYMTKATVKGVEPSKPFDINELKKLNEGLGGYAKRDGGVNRVSIDKDDKTAIINNSIKNTVSEISDKLTDSKINDTVKAANSGGNGSDSPTYYWSAAGYSSNYVPNTTYNMKGYQIDQEIGIGMLSADVDFTTQTSTIKWGDPATTLVMDSPSVYNASATGEDSFQVKQSGYDSSSPSTFTMNTIADSNGADYVSWGYWTKTNVTGALDKGVWIAGIPTISVPTSGSATYSGSIIGNTKDSGGVISQITTGTANFNVNFGATYSMTGSLAFTNASGQSWNASVSGSGFSGNSFAMNNSNISGTGGSINILNGSFYGPNAATIGGAFWFMNASNGSAVGVFKAAKQ